jgi:hypothetical protein
MQAANTLFYRVTEQKTPSGKIVGLNILGGFDPKLTFKSAAYRETALCILTTAQLEEVVLGLAVHANAAELENVTALGMLKKLAKNDLTYS